MYGPDQDIEVLRARLALAKEDLEEYEPGRHSFSNRVDLTEKLKVLARQDIVRFEALIKALTATDA